jgi:hypothetical protein
MINGAHAILYSRDAAADRAFFQDVLGLSHVDAGGGWLIFGLPPAEVAVHPAKKSGAQELYLMCDDISAFVNAMRARGLECSAVDDQGWGLLTSVTLPGGGKIGVYEPRHARPGAKSSARKAAPARAASARARKKPAAKGRAKKPSAARGRAKKKR